MCPIILLSLINLAIVSAVCPNGTITDEASKSCYEFVSELTSFTNAEQYCSSLGGHLASVMDAFNNAFIANNAVKYFGNTDSYLWLGGTTTLSPGNWTWTDGSKFTYTNWAPGQPTGNSGSLCTAMRYQSGIWYSQACYALKPYVCKIPQATCPTFQPCAGHLACPATFTYIDTTQSCYRILAGNSFFDYENLCQGGSKMISIHSKDETHTLISLLALYNFNYAWIGLADKQNTGDWEWLDGSVVDYSNWNMTWPQGISNDNCAQMDTKTGTWSNQFDCTSNQYPTICHMPANIDSKQENAISVHSSFDSCPTPPACPPASLVCPAGFIYIDSTQSCYMVISNMNFYEAQNACPSGSQLASIHSNGENDLLIDVVFLGYLTNYYVWIGFHDPLYNGNWQWTDGTPVDYTNWGGTPSNTTGYNCGCYDANGGGGAKYWYNQLCSTATSALCKIPANVGK